MLCLAGWLIAVFVFRPHIGRPDVLVMEQIHSGVYTDWYAPIHAATFRLLIQLQQHFGFDCSVQGLPYLCYITVLWSGLFLTLCPHSRFWRSTSAMPRWMALAVLVALGAVWSNLLIFSKSTSNCYWNLAAWLLAIGLLLNMPKRLISKVIVAAITLFFLYYGAALRHNLVFALFPLLCWLVWHFCRPSATGRRIRPATVIVVVAGVLWCGFGFLNHYVNYTVLKTYPMCVLQERYCADIFMLNYYAPKHYKNPPNTFGNRFDDLSKELFLSKYDPAELNILYAFDRINDALPSKLIFLKEFVKVLPERQFHELKTPCLYLHVDTGVLSDTPPGWKMIAINERDVFEQFPKDYVVLKNAWIDRIRQDPFIYLRIKVFWWVRTMLLGRTSAGRGMGTDLVPPEFFPIRLLSGGIANGFTLFCVMTLLCLYTFSPKRLEPQIFPFLMLAWSSLLTSLPLVLFIPDDYFRYLFYFFASSFISIAYFLAHSSLFAAMLRTVQQHVTAGPEAHGIVQDDCNVVSHLPSVEMTIPDLT